MKIVRSRLKRHRDQDTPQANAPTGTTLLESVPEDPTLKTKKRALLIGIQYSTLGENALRAPHRDVAIMRKLLTENYGYLPKDIVTLVDTEDQKQKQPTHENIIEEMKNLVKDAAPGDRFFFHYAGGAGTMQIQNRANKEEDEMDECIIPCDYNLPITDNVLRKILVDGLPSASQLVAIFDSAPLLDLEHFRCNRIYVPWISKGRRRNDSMWNSNVHHVKNVPYGLASGPKRPYETPERPSHPVDLFKADIPAFLSAPNSLKTLLGFDASSAPLVVESLYMELQRPGLEDGYRKCCMKYLKAMGKKFHALPPSLFMNNITRSGDHALTGGGFADIFKGKAGNMDVCLKVLRVHTAGSAEDRIRIIADFCQEALIWTQLRHSNILPLLGVNTELFPSCFCLVSPWMVNGDIISFLKKHPNHDKLQSICEIVAGLEYLHSLSPPIAHGDIKGANILVDEDHHCRLADFGLAVISAETITMASGTSGVFKGSIRWMAPEMYAFTIGTCVETNVKEDKAPRDIYAFGCTVLEILTGKPPFFNLIEAAVIYQVSVCRIRPERPSQSWCPDHIWNLIELCWDEDSVKRPTANAIHTYLQRLMLSDTATSGDSAFIENFHPAQSSTL